MTFPIARRARWREVTLRCIWSPPRPTTPWTGGRSLSPVPWLRALLARRSTRQDPGTGVLEPALTGANVYTDEWGAYHQLDQSNPQHATVNHGLVSVIRREVF